MHRLFFYLILQLVEGVLSISKIVLTEAPCIGNCTLAVAVRTWEMTLSKTIDLCLDDLKYSATQIRQVGY